jgi:hypothetical protein
MTKFSPFARLMAVAFSLAVYAVIAMPVLDKASQMV